MTQGTGTHSLREGGVERLEISNQGQIVGEMVQRIMVLRANEALVASITGHFGGRITMVMQVTCRFEATADGSRLTGTSQVVDLARSGSACASIRRPANTRAGRSTRMTDVRSLTEWIAEAPNTSAEERATLCDLQIVVDD